MFVEQGPEIKRDVYDALLFEHELVVKPDFTAGFVEEALRLVTMVSHAQMLELCMDQLGRDQLTLSSMGSTLEELKRRIDLAAEKFGKQVDLLAEVRDAPKEKN